MGHVRDSVLTHYTIKSVEAELEWQRRHEFGEPRLFVSSIGDCERKTILDAIKHTELPIVRDPTHPYSQDDYLTELFELGKELEELTWQAVYRQWPKTSLRDVPVGDKIWAGRMDFLIGMNSKYPTGAIIEHKATSPWNFRAKDRLPYLHHCYQVLGYQLLLKKDLGYTVPAYIYYRCWNSWAEVRIHQTGEGITWNGEIQGRQKEGLYEGVSLPAEMELLEAHWPPTKVPAIPYPDPFIEDFKCTKRGKSANYREINCPFYGICWPDFKNIKRGDQIEIGSPEE